MANGGNPGPPHSSRTRKNGYTYFFYVKHHRPKANDAAQWSPLLTRDREFQIFDDADFHELSDERKYLYGICRSNGRVLEIGTWGQQIAEFPFAESGQWHGYPLYPIREPGPPKRRSHPPSRGIFQKMVTTEVLTETEAKRLAGGHHI
jgi:hypothetical protein